ncbi:RHS repeat-associated core domain-containing protein [Streptomyces sp. NPDC057340]|uniref:RHS repeat-associated core domain-containing protein n=1 Tax=Streptomyces sp. NPDC057340 TaxID=3346103 RepID=UPI003634248E
MIVLVVLSVVAGGGWLVKVSGGDANGVDGKATITGGQTSPYGYTGQYNDPYLPDRLQLRARSYDTDQRRFTTQGPIPAAADKPNQSPYNYADNNPANLADPTGQCPMRIGAVIGSVVSGSVYAFTHQDDFVWGDFAVATTQGAVVGAVGGFLAPAGTALVGQLGLQGGRALGVAVVTDAAIGAGLTWAINTPLCQPTTPTDLLVGAITGGLGNFIGPGIDWAKGLLGKKPMVLPMRFGPGAAHAGDPAFNGGASQASETISFFKAPNRGHGQHQHVNGYRDKLNAYPDGRAYFGVGDEGRNIAEQYAKAYGEGIIEIQIPLDDYLMYFKRNVFKYEGGPAQEAAIPNYDLELLNDYPRWWHQ